MKSLLTVCTLTALVLLCGCRERRDPYNGWTDLGQAEVCISKLPDFGGGSLNGVKIGPQLVVTSSYHLYCKPKGQTMLYALNFFAANTGDVIMLRRIPGASSSYNPQDGYWGYNYEGINQDGETVYVKINTN